MLQKLRANGRYALVPGIPPLLEIPLVFFEKMLHIF
jgi:hypothetical protein